MHAPSKRAGELLRSHVPANYVGGIVPPALLASFHSLSAGVTTATRLVNKMCSLSRYGDSSTYASNFAMLVLSECHYIFLRGYFSCDNNTNPLSLANFVGIVVGFLNVCKIRLASSSLPPRYPLKAKWYKSFLN